MAFPPPSDNVFVGSLPGDITEDTVRTVFGAYGTVVECRVMPPKDGRFAGTASAMVRFSSVEEGTWIVENLNGNLAQGLNDPVVCRFANPGGAKGGGKGKGGFPGAQGGFGGKGGPYDGKGGGKGKNKGGFYGLYGAVKQAGILGGGTVPEECQLYISNLPQDTTDTDLYKLFAPFGAIAPTGVKAMPNSDKTGCVGIGFVDFVDPSCAATAVMSLQGFTLPDGTGIQVSTKKPSLSKGKGKGKGGAEEDPMAAMMGGDMMGAFGM